MPLTLDHVVIFVSDLDRARTDYAALGFTVIAGGDHPDKPTHNALVVFADGSYLELIAFKSAAADDRWWRVGSGAGEGFVDFALLPGDIVADVAAANARGLDLVGPIAGGRLRPDGERLAWQTARSLHSDVPFLCGDVTPRRLRVQEGDVRQHPNGVTGIAAISVAVSDIAWSLGRYVAYLGLDADGLRPHLLPGLGVAAVRLELGPAELVLLSPLPGCPSEVADALAARGEGPFALTFSSGGRTGPFDRELSHGARLEAVAPRG